MTEEMGNNMDFQDESVNVTAPSLAVSMINVNPDDFKGLTFGVSSISSNLNPQVRQYERYDMRLKRSAIVRYPRAEEKKPSLKLLLDSSWLRENDSCWVKVADRPGNAGNNFNRRGLEQ